MNRRIIVGLIAILILMNTNAGAQSEKDQIMITTDGIKFETKKSKDRDFGVEFAAVDVGINSLQDKSDYNSLAAKNLLQVPAAYQNENLFNLRSGKSWNVNVWPVLAKWRLLKTKSQKIYFGTGVGLQMYNFRFNRPVTYANDITPVVYLDTVNTITKNKLGFTYLSIPLMFTFKTRAAEKAWLVYGVGITGGYRLSSWTKQISDQKGLQKNHDKFNFSDFNSCITAEFGLDDYFRLYASYQVTPLQENALDQRPFSIGLRFGGL